MTASVAIGENYRLALHMEWYKFANDLSLKSTLPFPIDSDLSPGKERTSRAITVSIMLMPSMQGYSAEGKAQKTHAR